MKRYRIIRGDAYNGCIPITVYWVQVYENGFLSGKWRNVKRFDTIHHKLLRIPKDVFT